MVIKSLKLTNYKIFKGEKEFNFENNITVMKGKNASGKYTIFNAMIDSLTIRPKGVQFIADNIDLLQDLKEIVFIDGESSFNFLRNCKMPQKIQNITSSLAMGEKMILNFDFLMALRKAMRIDLPLVIGEPFARLDHNKGEKWRKKYLSRVSKQ